MRNIWSKVIAFLAKIVGIKTIPKEVANSDTLVANWWDIYSSHASWLPFSYVTSDGCHRKHTRRTLNPAKMICSEIAGLVLAEPPGVKAGALVDGVIRDEALFQNLRRYLEYQVALGGQAIKARPVGATVTVNEDGTETRTPSTGIALDFVTALNIIPLSSDNKSVKEASFIDRRVDGTKSFVRVETYKKEGAGYRVTSRAFDETTQLEVPLGILWPEVNPDVFIEIDEPPFVYMANPEANNIDPESPMGISAFHNAEDALKGIDIAFDEFVWEVESGARRIAIPGSCMRTYLDLDTGKNKQGFNPGDRVFMRLEGDDAEKFKPTDLTTDIRTQQFIDAINFKLKLAATICGFDAGYFSFDGASMKTATEIISENSHTYKTREAYRDVLNDGLVRLFRVINKLGKIYSIPGAVTDEPQIIWDDGIIEDRNSRAVYHETLYAQGLEDRVSAIKAIHGLDDKAAAEMAAKIKSDKAVVTDPFGMGA